MFSLSVFIFSIIVIYFTFKYPVISMYIAVFLKNVIFTLM